MIVTRCTKYRVSPDEKGPDAMVYSQGIGDCFLVSRRTTLTTINLSWNTLYGVNTSLQQ